ncbi:glycosyltransferase family 2 protein [Aureimonas sp. N4]|uniref:glycosyltransferase family 2 protein n=1 Tax=Aureimonas sp. N4 TaxID=1638165 RepID=UPI0012E3632E|nr:glycosyltransferase family 2 protein [Aureimonas sp. N4]
MWGWRVSVVGSVDRDRIEFQMRRPFFYGASRGLGKPRGAILDEAGEGASQEDLQRQLLAAFLAHAGIDAPTFEAAALAARRVGSSIEEELVARRTLTEAQLAEALSRTLGIPVEPIEPGVTVLRDAHGAWLSGPRYLKGCGSGFEARFHICPALDGLGSLARSIAGLGADRARLRITTRSDMARARAEFTQKERSDRARLSLSADQRRLSAREVMTGAQAAVMTLLFIGFGLAWATLPWFWFGAHLLCSLCALVLTTFRIAVLSETLPLDMRSDACAALVAPRPSQDETLPLYSVLVALHREAAMAPSVVRAMAALDWPRSRLEVFFVCEASDPETVHAVERAIENEPNFFVIATPRSDPLTKPKALNFTLPLAQGEFLVLYDAEDRPAPQQLRAAFESFRRSSDDLACLQAPLSIRNAGEGWFETLFAMEYDVLFKATLPWLAAHDLPLPLGGTSNHFRREVLLELGGWDSHNVAEDADLGIRLARAGYRTGIIHAPTSESATSCWRDWRNQRTRWIKGWIQTWLVHMREPRRLLREIGWRNLLAFQLVFGGMIASSLLHLVFGLHLTSAVVTVAMGGDFPLSFGTLVFLDVSNLLLAYAAFGALAHRVTPRAQRHHLSQLWSLWFYWAMVSFAGMRAIVQLVRAPHRWEKTPHQPFSMQGKTEPGPVIPHILDNPSQSASTTSA